MNLSDVCNYCVPLCDHSIVNLSKPVGIDFIFPCKLVAFSLKVLSQALQFL